MTPEHWQKIEAIVEAVEAAPHQDHTAVLERLCPDPELRSEVKRYLTEDNPGTYFLHLIGDQAATLNDTVERQHRFGRYELVRRIGQGGMGAVYEAVRVDDFHKKVALKIIRQGLDSDFARKRFLQERQLLANLEHPYIARMLDGGETDDGSPYLVMEFIAGEPIDDYAARLDQTARLRLFLKVCEAVGHAHRNLVIHRDLKPANILVTPDGDPKLLDFGIAKLLDPTASNTQTGFALTPDYASPEQIRGEPIFTASDVYSLGVILYQILIGRKPYTLTSSTSLEMDRVVCNQPPEPPGLGDELDHILLMALRKEPERRYASVERFADDIERYLGNRPVQARPDTTWYRTRKYVRRHWVALAAATLALTGICASAGIAIYQARIARQQAAIAQQRFGEVRQISNTFLFDFDKEIATLQGSVKARRMLVDTALKYLASLSRDAGGDVALQRELAQAYQRVGDVQGAPGGASLGKLDEALVSYGKSVAIFQEVARHDPKYRTELAHAQTNLGYAWLSKWDLGKAEYHIRAAIQILETVNGDAPGTGLTLRTLAAAEADLASIYLVELNDDAALSTFNRVRDYQEAGIVAKSPADQARLREGRFSALIKVYLDQADVPHVLEAAQTSRSLLEIWKRSAPTDANIVWYEQTLEEALSLLQDSDYVPSLGDTGQALVYLKAAERLTDVMTKDKSDVTAQGLRTFHMRRFSYLLGKSDPQAGLEYGRKAIALLEEISKTKEVDSATTEVLASTRILVAQHLSRLGREPEARAAIAAGLADYKILLDTSRNAPISRRSWLRSLASVAGSWRKLNNLPAALNTAKQAASEASEWQAGGSREIGLLYVLGDCYVEYGRCLLRARRPDEARQWLAKDAAIWKSFPETNRYVALRNRQAAANLAELR